MREEYLDKNVIEHLQIMKDSKVNLYAIDKNIENIKCVLKN